MTDGARMSAERLSEIETRVMDANRAGHYYGAAIKVARHGELLVDLAVGHADAAGTWPITTDSVFSIFSVTKAFINVLVLRWIEAGRFALTTKMVDLVPEFAGTPPDRARIFHFLTYTTGMPGVWEPAPGLYIDDLSETLAEVVARVHGVAEPGTRCEYSPMPNHVLLADAIRRTDPEQRSITEILRAELWEPLGMSDTSLGIASHTRGTSCPTCAESCRSRSCRGPVPAITDCSPSNPTRTRGRGRRAHRAICLTDELLSDPVQRDVLLGRIPMDRFGHPDDIAGPTVFLATNAAAYVTGQLLMVDGGWTAA